jgi:hypothetical protein
VGDNGAVVQASHKAAAMLAILFHIAGSIPVMFIIAHSEKYSIGFLIASESGKAVEIMAERKGMQDRFEKQR